MKKILFLLALASIGTGAFAQKAMLKKAWRALSDYDATLADKPDISYLQSAKEAIDAAEKSDETKNMGKTYAYKCRIYYALFQYNLKQAETQVTETQDKTARMEIAYEKVQANDLATAYKALQQLKAVDPKYFTEISQATNSADLSGEEDTKLLNIMLQMGIQMTNVATSKYKQKQYDEAAGYFANTYDYYKNFNKKDTAFLYNAVLSSQKAKNTAKVVEYNQLMIAEKIANAYTYQSLYDVKIQATDTNGAQEILKQGRIAFPNDIYLLNRETELFLQRGKQEEALVNLQKALEKEPDNAQFHLVIGTVYDGLANPKGADGKDAPKPANFDDLVKQSEEHYKKVIDLKPSNQESYFYALYNLGAMYFNYGNYIYNKGMNDATIAKLASKQKEVEANSMEYYKKAIPYLEQARSLRPDDNSTLFALRTLYMKVGDSAKAKEISDKMKKSE